MKHYYLGKDGLVHTRKTEFYNDTPIKQTTPQEQELIDFCLNCKKRSAMAIVLI